MDIFERNEFGFTKMDVTETTYMDGKKNTWDVRPVTKSGYFSGASAPEEWKFNTRQEAIAALGKYNDACKEQRNDKTDKETSQSSSGLLYGVVEWLNDNSILDGMKYFTNKEEAVEYGDKQEHIGRHNGFNVRCTIIRLERP